MYSHVSNVSLSSFPFPRHVNRAEQTFLICSRPGQHVAYMNPSHTHAWLETKLGSYYYRLKYIPQVGIALSSFPFDMSDNQNRMCVQCFQWDGKLFVRINSYSSRVVLAVCVLCAYHLTAIVAYIQRDFRIFFRCCCCCRWIKLCKCPSNSIIIRIWRKWKIFGDVRNESVDRSNDQEIRLS